MFPMRMLLLLLIMTNWTQVTLALWNSALFKPTSQSSDYYHNSEHKSMKMNDESSNIDSSRHAVDGSEESCSKTESDEPAWFIVDLQGDYTIEKVMLTANSQYTENLRNFRIEVFQSDPRNRQKDQSLDGDICAVQGEKPLYSGDNFFDCEPALKGRYVRLIWQEGYKNYLSICELEILVGSPASSLNVYYGVKDKVRVTDNPLLVVGTCDPLMCALECNNRRDQELCMAFNWNSKQCHCRLFSVKPQDVLAQTVDEDWSLYRMED